MRKQTALGVLLLFVFSRGAEALPFGTIPGFSNPWLAGMPPGSIAGWTDVAPEQSPVQITDVAVHGSEAFSFLAYGSVAYDPSVAPSGPDGTLPITYHADYVTHYPTSENGIANVFSPYNALLGVFLGPGLPTQQPAPPGLDFTTDQSRDFLALYPVLQQPFFIGDGRNSQGIAQRFYAPGGATRLFLGTMDSSQWANNLGQFYVEVVADVPEPPCLLIWAVGLAAFHWSAWRRRGRDGGQAGPFPGPLA